MCITHINRYYTDLLLVRKYILNYVIIVNWVAVLNVIYCMFYIRTITRADVANAYMSLSFAK